MHHFAFNAFHTLLVMAVGRVAGEKNALASRGSTGPPWARASGCRGARGRSAVAVDVHGCRSGDSETKWGRFPNPSAVEWLC